ncbi:MULTISPECIES: metal-dependent transcriptional regulator [unclassified Jeotgalibaca]|uniref:metal-dependent transcriptional regulator n=1 Tax=unclassified Jeotgalibaca TaxID=2621505 RepID=UPI003FD346E2
MTPQKEDYLKVIVELGGDENLVNNKLIGAALSVSAASVTEMSFKLLKEGYIIHVPYQGVKLSDKGIIYANQMIRKHRLWEVFLAKKLGFGWEEVHDMAEALEHVSSDILIDRLEEFLEYPSVDPHGGLIPDREGKVPNLETCYLHEMEAGCRFMIMEVDDDTHFLKYLSDKRIKLGTSYQLIEKEPFEGSIHFSDEVGEVFQVSFKASHKVMVQEKRD